MNVKEIVATWLEDNGFDGLFNTYTSCACEVGDLSPCGEMNERDCEAGYRTVCDGTCDEGNCDFHIVKERREPGAPSWERLTRMKNVVKLLAEWKELRDSYSAWFNKNVAPVLTRLGSCLVTEDQQRLIDERDNAEARFWEAFDNLQARGGK